MRDDSTVREPARTLPVRGLRVEVTEGADASQSVVAASDAITIGTAERNDLVLSDRAVSRFHVELKRTPEGVLVVDHESTNGTFVGGVRIFRAVVPAGTELSLGKTVLRIRDEADVRLPLHEADTLAGLCGQSPAMRRLMAQVERAAKSDVSVLIVGESGTGKEVVARALHELGPRAAKPIVTVDCGALAPSLVASELFGHEKGAFTGADRQHVGAFEQADGGTLFLDEVGELPAQLQSSLLGALERRRFKRLGGRSEVEVDVRVVSATNRDLRGEVNRGAFRLDLFYRLAVVQLELPPLRDRAEDIPLLAEHFARAAGHDEPLAKLFPPQAMMELARHHWSGNVRELRNVVEATLAMGETPRLGASQSAPPGALGDVLELRYKDARARVLADFERAYLARLLDRTDRSVTRAAREAGLDRTHLSHLLHRHGLR
ncbi:MAG TPA: sigma 54-interacting transcriptional regulator [Polyangiaceae bacterium]|jgi:DNA-binding NtrC family response regulator